MDTAPRADVEHARERRLRRRWFRLAAIAVPLVIWAGLRLARGEALIGLTWPQVDPLYLMSGGFFLMMTLVLIGSSVISGRSPHVTYRPEQIDVRLSDVKGIAPVVEEVRRSLDLFRSAATFRRVMGGTPRRGLLFEGAPGTGKTHLAKAMAAEAGVPFLFVSATSFQSMYYGATARRIRSYFAALRKAARAEGAAIGFIEEIDAIAASRGGVTAASGSAPGAGTQMMACGGLVGLPGSQGGTAARFSGSEGGMSAGSSRLFAGAVRHPASMTSEGVGGVVNELLVQMQSFDSPTGWQRARSVVTDAVNLMLPAAHQIPRPRIEPVNILLIAATNRADALDPALLRPGRFDRRLTFDLPDATGRRELVDHYLSKKAHHEELAGDQFRDALTGVTQGYSPVMIEHLLDEGLVNAVRRNDSAMNWADLEHARLVLEVGLGRDVGYTPHEKRLIATHEAGHAVMAWLVAPHRRLEILTIVRRAGALGLLAHGDTEDVFTRSRRELLALIQIAFGGLVAEELFVGDVSTGPGSDLAYATTIAAQMVGAAGMSDTLISFSAIHGSALATSNLAGQVLGDAEGRRMVEALLEEQRGVARRQLGAHRHLVEALRDTLLERHELIGEEITAVLRAASGSDHEPGADANSGLSARVLDLREGSAPTPR